MYLFYSSLNCLMVNNRTIKPFYSVRNDFTGLAKAALIAWKLTVSNAIINAAMPAVGNTHHAI